MLLNSCCDDYRNGTCWYVNATYLCRKIASLLMQGKVVSPEAFDLVTLSFSDIVGFQKIVFASNPFQVCSFLLPDNFHNLFIIVNM